MFQVEKKKQFKMASTPLYFMVFILNIWLQLENEQN